TRRQQIGTGRKQLSQFDKRGTELFEIGRESLRFRILIPGSDGGRRVRSVAAGQLPSVLQKKIRDRSVAARFCRQHTHNCRKRCKVGARERDAPASCIEASVRQSGGVRLQPDYVLSLETLLWPLLKHTGTQVHGSAGICGVRL